MDSTSNSTDKSKHQFKTNIKPSKILKITRILDKRECVLF